VKWKKIGKIFDPSHYNSAQGYDEFAKSPQAIVCDGYVRVFYCAQRRGADGKYVSVPHYVDFNKSFDKVLGLSDGPVIKLGDKGEFDEHGIFPLNIIKHDHKIWGYTSGWSRRQSVSIDMAIGLAISSDQGVSFHKYGKGGPIMAASLNEPFLVGDPFVKYIHGSFHMWYIFGTEWLRATSGASPERIYKIAYAHSSDGINWQRNGMTIIPAKRAQECQALPTVFYDKGKYHMYFCHRDVFDFRDNKEKAYRLGYAFSDDMIVWHRDDSQAGIDVSEEGWDSDMMCYPNVFECDGGIFLLYNGNEFGKHGFGLAQLVA